MKRLAPLLAAVMMMWACGDDSDPGETMADASDATAETPDTEVDEETTGADPDTEEPNGDDVIIGDGPSFVCLEESCQLDACLAVDECARAADCVGDCDTWACAEACRADVSPPFRGLIDDVIACGALASCYPNGSGLDGCGDGTCGGAETKINCAEDCSPFGDPTKTYQCLIESCNLAQCAENGQCNFGLECISGCGDVACTSQCINSQNSGQIRALLRNAVDCGVKQYCIAPKVGPECGNGACEETFESSFNCAEDCGALPEGYQCILESCNVGQCPNFGSCNNALVCIGDCETASCVAQCINNGPHQAYELMISVAECAAGHGCIPEDAVPGEADCGNGECELGEDVVSCFKDCKPGPEACGNGVCDQGESIAECPQDCKPDAASCVGDCYQELDDAPCHCEENCEQWGSCCSDFKSFCEGDTFQCILGCEGAGQCAQANSCSEALGCIAECKGDNCEACLEGQPQQNIGFLEGYIECAAQNQCWETAGETTGDDTTGGDTTGGDTTGGDTTGDTTGGDTTGGDTTGGDGAECLAAGCKPQLEACQPNGMCLSALPCVEECGKDGACAAACGAELTGEPKALFDNLIVCATDQECFGD